MASSSLDLGEARWKRQGLKGAEREESGRGIQNNGELPDGGLGWTPAGLRDEGAGSRATQI